MKILLVEDEKKINEMLTLYLKQDGHHVHAFLNAETAMAYLEKNKVNLIISDLMLPGMQGEAFIKSVRKTSDVYIIVLTAKGGDDPKLKLLGDGVDDYIKKPFSIDEILLKVRNIDHRITKDTPFRFHYNDSFYVYSTKTNTLHKDGETIDLNHIESKLLTLFLHHPFQVLSRDQIIEQSLNESDAFDRIVDTYIKNLRKKLFHKEIIETVYGSGYRFKGELYA